MASNTNVYEIITDRIIAELEKGIIPWSRPWVCVGKGYGKAVSHTNGRPYSLLNQLLLGRPGEYLTFNQCKKEGGSVKKGAKSRMVCFWKMLRIEEKYDDGTPVVNPETGKQVIKVVPLLKYYNVFHIDDCEGITAKYAKETKPATPATVAEIDAQAEKVLREYIAREGITLEEEESDEAYYSPARDLIHLPVRKQFALTSEYYSTAFHEATHSTGHKSRLDRFTTGRAAGILNLQEELKKQRERADTAEARYNELKKAQLSFDDLYDFAAMLNDSIYECEKNMEQAAKTIVDLADTPSDVAFQNAVNIHRRAKQKRQYTADILARVKRAREHAND